MISGRSTQHILQMLKAPQDTEYNIVANQHCFSQLAALKADCNAVDEPIQELASKSNIALETLMQQIRQFA